MRTLNRHAKGQALQNPTFQRWLYFVSLVLAAESIYMLPYLRKTFQTSIGFFWHADHQRIYKELRKLARYTSNIKILDSYNSHRDQKGQKKYYLAAQSIP